MPTQIFHGDISNLSIHIINNKPLQGDTSDAFPQNAYSMNKPS